MFQMNKSVSAIVAQFYHSVRVCVSSIASFSMMMILYKCSVHTLPSVGINSKIISLLFLIIKTDICSRFSVLLHINQTAHEFNNR